MSPRAGCAANGTVQWTVPPSEPLLEHGDAGLPRRRTVELLRALDLFHLVALDGVAHLQVLELLDADAALVALLHGLHVVLEAAQRRHVALEDDRAVAHDAHLVVAVDLAFHDVAAGDGAHLRHLEGLAHLGDAGVLFHDIGRQQTHARGVDVLDGLIDDAVQADVHLLLLGLLATLARGTDVEADDDGVGGGGQGDVGLGDAAHGRVHDVDAHLGLIHLVEGVAQSLDGALDVGLHDEVQIGRSCRPRCG